MVNAPAGLDVRRTDIEFHRIVLKCFPVENIQFIRQFPVAEIRAVKIAGLNERSVTAVSRIFAESLVISDRSADLS